ncbi:unannotated protein [freshwater metagenome]|uniref:Unannotated protein n=1 Tax=freshwater metagenome TaxID=449393 RepID=A0A6J6GZE1_9ZZZZ
MRAKVELMPQATHWRASIVGAFAMAEAYENGETWLDSTLQTLDENRHHLKRELQRLFPEVDYIIPEAGYLAWLDVTSWNLGEQTVSTLIRDAKVALVPGNDHGPEYTNHVRFNFGTSPELITEGLTRIARALHN